MPARIQHVVVLMLENRSFDHFFGFDGKGNGLSGSESNWLDPSSPGSASNHSFQVGADAPFAITKGQGPGHSLNAANWQLCNSKSGPSAGFPAGNNGFARNYRDELIHDHVGSPSFDDIAVVMKSFGRIQLPSMNALADQFCLCDNWYSEVPARRNRIASTSIWARLPATPITCGVTHSTTEPFTTVCKTPARHGPSTHLTAMKCDT